MKAQETDHAKSDVEKRLASWLSGRISFLASPLSETSVGLWGERRQGAL